MIHIEKDWLQMMENQINKVIDEEIVQINENRALLGLQDIAKCKDGMTNLLNLINFTPSRLKKIPRIDDLSRMSELPPQLRIDNVEFEQGNINLPVTLFMVWFKGGYKVKGLSVNASDLKSCDRMLIECGEGYPDFGAYFVFWYINDIKHTPLLHVGTRNFSKSNLCIGRGVRNCLLNGVNVRFAEDVFEHYKVDYTEDIQPF